MALIKCPECGRDKISDKATNCPDCGFPVASHFEELELEETREQREKEANREEWKEVGKQIGLDVFDAFFW